MLSTDLLNKTLSYFNQFQNEHFVVMPSLPILYFGDTVSYKNSSIKIVTVGKNPSVNEFRLKKTDDYSFIRFPKWNENDKNLQESLDSYFENNPLKSWFSSFEPILNGLNASYYKGSKLNRAIHTDICSPLATNPTWSLLNDNQRETLFKEGIILWKQLIEELQPDFLFVSIPKNLFHEIFSSSGKELVVFETKKDGEERKKPYQVFLYEYHLKSKKVKVVFGQAANKPFDTISESQKFEIGKKCQE